MGLIPAPILPTFPQAPLRSRTVGFPQSGSDLGFPLGAFPVVAMLKCWLTSTPLTPVCPQTRPRFEGRLLSAQSPRTTLGPPSAQSPFATIRCYRLVGDVVHLLGGRYPAFIAPTGSCARPIALPPPLASPRARGLCRLRPALAAQRPFPTLSLPNYPYVSGPLLRWPPGCLHPFLPKGHWPSPRLNRVGASQIPQQPLQLSRRFLSCSQSL